jgi:hypothetical protein
VVELMPETKTRGRPAAKTQRRPAAKKQAATPKRRVRLGEHDATKAVERTKELSEDVLKSLDEGARTAIEAVRKFVRTVDAAVPSNGDGPSKRAEINDSALEMAQRLVRTQYDFLRKVMDSAGKSLSRSDDAK